MNQEIPSTPNPTGRITSALKQENKPGNQALIRFFDSNSGFDFKTARIDSYLADHPNALLHIAADEKKTLIRQLNQLQRLFWITDDTPNQYAAMRRLIDDGLDSAQAIASIGIEAFCSRYLENPGELGNPRTVHTKASQRAATAMALFSKYSPQYNSIEVAAIGPGAINAASTVGAGALPASVGNDSRPPAVLRGNGGGGANGGPSIPDWEKLFGSLNRCQCEHCRSVLSPSAYLVDLLHQLKELKLTGDTTALDVLHERRPDIVEIPMTCTNANTTLPYVDLVNEVLETAIHTKLVGSLEFEITEDRAQFETELNHRQVSDALCSKFLNAGYPLTNKARVLWKKESSPGTTTDWEIECQGYGYNINSSIDKFIVSVSLPWRRLGTTTSTNELGAYPEHLDTQVYDALREQFFPWVVPFDLWAEEARVYLDHLGVSRHQLMDLLITKSDKQVRIASEYFHLTQTEINLLFDKSSFDLSELWGFQKSDTSWLDSLAEVPEFLKRSGVRGYDQLTELLTTRYVNPSDKDAESSRIKFPSLDSQDERVANSACDYTKATIVWPVKGAEASLQRIHCFLRLQRKTAWSIGEFNKVLTALGYAGRTVEKCKCFDGDLLIALQRVHVLQACCDTPFDELLSWFANIDTDRRDSATLPLYDRLFLDRSIQGIEETSAFALNNVQTELQNAAHAIDSKSGHHSIISSALRISQADLDRLIEILSPDKEVPKLNLENLSCLYRCASLARAFRLGIVDFLTLAKLTGFRPAANAEPNIKLHAVVDFIANTRLVERSGCGIAELDYLLRHGDSAAAPDDRQIGWLLADIQSGLKAIDDEVSSVAHSGAEQMKAILLRLDWPDDVIDRAIDLLRKSTEQLEEKADVSKLGRTLLKEYLRSFEVPTCEVRLAKLPSSIEFPAAFHGKLQYDADAGYLYFRGWMSEAEQQMLLSLEQEDTYQEAINALSDRIEHFEPSAQAARFIGEEMDVRDKKAEMTVEELLSKSVEVRWQVILKQLIPYARSTLSEQLIKQKLGEGLGLEARTVHELLTKHLQATGSEKMAIDTLLSPAFIKNPAAKALTRKGFPDQFKTFDRLNKAAMLVGRLRIEPDQLDWLFGDERFDGIDLNTLPLVQCDSPDRDLYQRFASLVKLCTVRDRIGAQAATGLLNLALSDSEKARKGLADGTGWSTDDIDALIINWDLTNKNREPKLKNWTATTLMRFYDSLEAIRGLGCKAETAMKWCEAALSHQLAQEIRQAVKAKYDEKRWLEVARPLRDVLREKQRAALVDYLLVQEQAADANTLYKKYLLDVEMSPCMQTSRTKLAISSVQLFVQRLLMNLEAYRIPQNQAAFCKKQWQWLKNYRVWEANRKVFLYPENWIEPELRKDKTPFFKELETELLQAEMTDESAERAFRNYLQQLAEVAKLEVCGMFHEREQNDSGHCTLDVLHVFARTGNVPRTHYYRRRANNVWSSWEKVTTGINGEHLIPVVFNRRLYLFWPEITTQTENVMESAGKPAKTSKGVQKTWEFWEIKLAFCEYRQGMWSGKQTMDTVLRVDHPSVSKNMPADEEKHSRAPEKATDFTFMTELEAQAMTIRCAQKTKQSGDEWIGGFLVSNDERARVLRKEELSQSNTFPSISFAGGSHDAMMIRLPAGKELKIDGEKLFGRCGPGARILMSHEFAAESSNGGPGDFFYQDDDRVIYVSATSNPAKKYHLANFYHPDLTDFLRHLNREGLSGLLQRGPQASTSETLLFQIPNLEAAHFTEKEPSSNDQKRIVQLFFLQDRKRTLEERELMMKEPNIKFLKPSPKRGIQREIEEAELSLSTLGFAVTPAIQSEAAVQTVDTLIAFSNGKKEWECLARSDAGAISILQDFEQQYQPTELIEGTADKGLPAAVVDFQPSGAYSQYNWELFFHAPLLLASALSKNQRFEEAQRWFHYIFDPTDVSGHKGPKRYWKTLPFFADSSNKVVDLIALLHYSGDSPELQQKRQDLQIQIERWRQTPFEPHVIAAWRLDAYQKTVVMKYIDNLIAWADQLFRQDTIESINEATQLYILAAEILGKRPLSIAPQRQPMPHSFDRLSDILDGISDALVALETAMGETQAIETVMGEEPPADPSLKKTPYFCVPDNDKLLSYWDTVADRLFKIRHCQNIEGIERALRLYEPPIEPGLLVRAAAAGIDISSALRDMNAPLPHHRFAVMLKKALEFCNDVKALGGAYLSALEKKDAEGLEELKRRQRGPDIRTIKEQQLEDAKNAVQMLELTEAANTLISSYYTKKRDRVAGYNATIAALGIAEKSLKAVSLSSEAAAAVAAVVPDVEVNLQGLASGSSSKVGGGKKTKEALQATAKSFAMGAEISATLSKAVEFAREIHNAYAENDHQKDLLKKENEKLAIQKDIAKARVTIAEQELKNLDIQAMNAAEVDDYLRRKFTNQELYNWRVSQLSALFFQSYQMAYDLAKRAERAFRYELGDDDTSFIRFGYWDSLKKGLLAGEQIYFDLKRMEKAYLERDRRGFEITRHISLKDTALLDLARLKEEDVCFVDLPERLFDGDYPGHYRRRIKSVSLTIDSEPKPGDHANINCTLTLLKNAVRMQSSLDSGYVRKTNGDDRRFRDELGAVQSIVTSSGKNDSGLFQVNFHDDRYLPFEGAGVISTWKIELPKERNPDLGELKDVVLHVKYTALDGGEALKLAAQDAVKKAETEARKQADLT